MMQFDRQNSLNALNNGNSLIVLHHPDFLRVRFFSLGVKQLLKNFPSVTILTSEVHSDCPSYFGQRYFGTD